MELTLQGKIHFFSELITCSNNLHYWCFDPTFTLLSTNCQNELVYDALFSISGCKELLKEHIATPQTPLVMTDALGLMWIAAFETSEDIVTRIHTIGPAFITDISVQTLEKKLSNTNYSVKLKRTFMVTLRALPVLSLATYYQYGQMLHYTITCKKIPIGNFRFVSVPSEEDFKGNISIPHHTSRESHGTWATEQELTRMVEEGNLEYQDAFDKIAVTGATGEFHLGDPIRQAKIYVLTFIILCSRAALRAGLSPELAYTLSDFYIQSTENAVSISEAQEIGHTMYKDYIFRVHELKKNSHISKQVQESCNYIQIHSAEKLSISDIAAQVGYAEYYFSKKFKKEMGINIKEYIKRAKINRAKIMLKSETSSIQDISEALNFCSQSYFAETFQKFTGMTPGEYRTQSTSSK